jgi:hypothetical protein
VSAKKKGEKEEQLTVWLLIDRRPRKQEECKTGWKRA